MRILTALGGDAADGEIDVRVPPVDGGRELLERDGVTRVADAALGSERRVALEPVVAAGSRAVDVENSHRRRGPCVPDGGVVEDPRGDEGGLGEL